MAMRSLLVATGLAVTLLPSMAVAGGGPFGIDHKVAYDDSGIWNRSYQKALAAGAALGVIGGAVFGDNDTRWGRTFDQSLDAMILTAGTATVMKYTFSRKRPSETDDPNEFFSGHGHQSFPSGEVAEISSIVTPFMAEYGSDHPAVYALALLPAYDAVARVKVQAHWQSDVLAGAAVGIAWGIYAHHRKTPLILGLLPGQGFTVGYSRQF